MSQEITITTANNPDEYIAIHLEGDSDVRITFEKNAQAKLFLQYADKDTVDSKIHISQQQNSHCYLFDNASNVKSVSNTFVVDLNESGAHCSMQGIFVTSGKQQVSNDIVMHHNAPHTHSSQNYKGIAKDQSTGCFYSRVIVKKDAQKITSSQSNKNLLLSKTATIRTKPELEIYADDVKCAHGATVGELNADAIFYLQSRGIPQEQARAMLIEAFIAENIPKDIPTLIHSPLAGESELRSDEGDKIKGKIK